MSTAARKLKINRRYASCPCSWCGEQLQLGGDGSVCEACETPHHTGCWTKENGCSDPACINAPLRKILDQLLPEEMTSETNCPMCGTVLPKGISQCPVCQLSAADDLEPVEPCLSDESYQAFLVGILSLVVPPILFLLTAGHLVIAVWVPVAAALIARKAFQKAKAAKSQIAGDPTLKGSGMALAAETLAAIGVIFSVAGLLPVVMTSLKPK